MASLPPSRQISLQQIPGAPSWLGALLTPLNQFMGAVYDALNKGLTSGQNLGNQQIATVQATMGAFTIGTTVVTNVQNPGSGIYTGTDAKGNTVTGTTVKGGWTVASFKYTTQSKPLGVSIVNIVGPAPLSAVALNQWHIANTSISLDSVVGLAPGNYTLTILVVA